MNIITANWSDRHKELSSNLRKAELFEKNIALTLDLHRELHTAKVSQASEKNLIDHLLEDLLVQEYAVMPTSKDETIAWAIWHIARIEDLTMNILVNRDTQVFDETRRIKMGISISDTGNAMSDDEILKFSSQIQIEELLKYRDDVGIRSREILGQLKPTDMKRKVEPKDVERILQEGGVTEQKDSIWLLDFWGRKDVAGIILMPLTRHQTLHLNDCDKWKSSIRKKTSKLQ